MEVAAPAQTVRLKHTRMAPNRIAPKRLIREWEVDVLVFMMTSFWSWVVATVECRAAPGFGLCEHLGSRGFGNKSFSYGSPESRTLPVLPPGHRRPASGSPRSCRYRRTAQPGPLAGGLPLRQRQKHGQERPQDYRAPADWLLLLRDLFHGGGDGDGRKWSAGGCGARRFVFRAGPLLRQGQHQLQERPQSGCMAINPLRFHGDLLVVMGYGG